MRPFLPLFLLAACLTLGGCAIRDWFTESTTKAEIQQTKTSVDQTVAMLQESLATARRELGDAKFELDATGSELARKTVANLQKAEELISTKVAQAKQLSDALQVKLDTMPEGGQPRWKALLVLAMPFLLPLGRNLPVVGPFVGIIGGVIETATASNAKRAEWAEIEAKAKALRDQTAFANDLLKIVPKESAQPVKDSHRATQELAGTLATIRKEVLVVESAAA